MQTAKQQIDAALRARFPNNNVAPEHLGELLAECADSGVGPPHLVAEIEMRRRKQAVVLYLGGDALPISPVERKDYFVFARTVQRRKK